jgi:hypothetical protein
MLGDVLRDRVLLRVAFSEDVVGWQRILGLCEGSLVGE